MDAITISKPKSEIKITIGGEEYGISYPDAGNLIDISALKAKLSDDQYSSLLYQNSSESGFSIKLIDTFCFFTVMLPDLKKKLNVTSLLRLKAYDSLDLIHIYDSIIVPWMEEWAATFNNRINELKGVTTNPKEHLV